MQPDRAEAITTLLLRAEEAHATFEATELGGVYDAEWAQWYAGHAIEHGIADLLGHAVAVEDVARFLASTFAEFEQARPPGTTWAAFIAERMVLEL
ncbi:MAG TPA: hypothetical protein VI277_09115 [Candidatus Limnocylindria bacterium]